MKESECYPGKNVGRLTLIERHREHFKSYGNRWVWHCKCDCGNTIDRPTFMLGPSKSRRGVLDCGKHSKENHSAGALKSSWKWYKNESELSDKNMKSKFRRIHDKWKDMLRRCENPTTSNFPEYGGRGITVCDEWHDYNVFKKWILSEGFDVDNHNRNEQQLDRIDVNGNYEPQNCRLANSSIQQNNRRDNVYLTYNGKIHTASEWGRILGIKITTIEGRLQKGLPTELVLSSEKIETPGVLKVLFHGRDISIPKLSKEIGINPATLYTRYNNGLRGDSLCKPVDK